MLQKVKPVYNASQLLINLQPDSAYFRHYKGNYQPFAEIDTVDMSPRLLEAATTATSLHPQLGKRSYFF